VAVLVEAVSVIIRRDRLPPPLFDLDPSVSPVWNTPTICTDGELVRIGFFSVPEAESCVKTLAAAGLQYVQDGVAQDLVIVDQTGSPSAHGDWFEFGSMTLERDEVLACQMTGSGTLSVTTPTGWTYEGSVTEAYNQLPPRAREQMLRLVCREDGVHAYRHPVTGKEMGVGVALA
jgi:hypothetical protein